MIRYEALVDGVRDRAGLNDGAEAALVVGAVLNTLAQVLPQPDRDELAGQLPASFERVVDVHTPTQDVPGVDVVQAIAGRLGVPAERALFLAHTVLRQLHEQDAALVERLRGQLPTDVADAVAPPGTPAELAASVDPGMPTRLTADEVTRQLHGLTNWTGDEHHIERTVALPDERIEPLVNRVEREARARNDHAGARRGAGEVTFVLRTADRYVTEADIALAQRIDELVLEFAGVGA